MEHKLQEICQAVSLVVVGQERTRDLILAAFLAGGHVLMEDLPGTGKTLMAKTLAKTMDMEFGRVQFTPDLMPSDVTGIHYYNQKAGEFQFKKGPVFSNILLADEINRAAPRTQSSLLEAMEERQVTIDGESWALPDPFFCNCYPESSGKRRNLSFAGSSDGPLFDENRNRPSKPGTGKNDSPPVCPEAGKSLS